MSDLINGTILGIVEGFSEYLPVSSTAHLIVAGHLLGFQGEKADTFEIFIQLGAILAVVILYFDRFLSLLKIDEPIREKSFRGKSGIIKLALGCLPAFILGFLLHGFIKTHLFSPIVVAYSLIIGGIILVIFRDRGDQTTTTLDDVTYKQSFTIGLFQALALYPGVSRSGATMIGAMLIGCRRSIAAEFSFLLAVPTMCAAVGYDLLKSIKLLSLSDIPLFAIGFIISFITAYIVVKAFVSFLSRSTLWPFGVYRIILGTIVLYFF